MEIRYLGHSCFLIKLGNKSIIFDPYITENPLASTIDLEDIKVDYMLLSHGHLDHVADVERLAEFNKEVKVISSFEIVNWFEKKGITGHPMSTGGYWKFDFGQVKCVSAVHSNSLPDGSYGGSAMGFVVSNETNCFYFAGDTALHLDMKLIPLTSPKLDFAILPIGNNFTMGYEDAVVASEFIECDKIIGCHYDTFGYIKIDHQKTMEAFNKKNKELHLPKIGELVIL